MAVTRSSAASTRWNHIACRSEPWTACRVVAVITSKQRSTTLRHLALERSGCSAAGGHRP
jgi:hypothetical protein